ncbi:MAG: hypothetical protein ACLFWL_12370 [Candidatus Brocadiia bacterium]
MSISNDMLWSDPYSQPSSDITYPDEYPKWTISNGDDTKELQGTEVSFNASGFDVTDFFLYDLDPEVYSIVCEPLPDSGTKERSVFAYPDVVNEQSVRAPDVDDFVKLLDKLERAGRRAGTIGYFNWDPKPDFSGSVGFQNQYEEIGNSHRVGYAWELSGGLTGEAGVRVYFSGAALAGVPTFLIDAQAFIGGSGSISLEADVGKDAEQDDFYGGGSLAGAIGVTLGGKVTALHGVASAELSGNTNIYGEGTLRGYVEPPRLACGAELGWGGLEVVYEVSAIWGLWSRTESWQAIDGHSFYETEIPLVPGVFGGD